MIAGIFFLAGAAFAGWASFRARDPGWAGVALIGIGLAIGALGIG